MRTTSSLWVPAGAVISLLICVELAVAGNTGACQGPFSIDRSPRGNKLRHDIDRLGLTPQNAEECFSLFAEGTQNYACPYGNGTWTLTNPNAVLLAKRPNGAQSASQDIVVRLKGSVVSHYFLSTPDSGDGVASWESNLDGSRVTTRAASLPVAARVDSPDGPENIPWLSTVRSSGKWGPTFGRITAVVRAETRGGVEPDARLCNRVGKVKFVPYTSAYVFYASKA